MVVSILLLLFVVVPCAIYFTAGSQGFIQYAGSIASFFTPAGAILFISTRTKHPKLTEISRYIDAYNDRNDTASPDIDHGARFEIYSHYLGLSAQIVVGLVGMLVISSFLPYGPLWTFGLIGYLLVGVLALWKRAEDLTPSGEEPLFFRVEAYS